MWGAPADGALRGGFALLATQALGLLAVIIYAAVVSFAILKLTDKLVGLRVSSEVEREGLDIPLHGESGVESGLLGGHVGGSIPRKASGAPSERISDVPVIGTA
jgi:hypothetical protein